MIFIKDIEVVEVARTEVQYCIIPRQPVGPLSTAQRDIGLTQEVAKGRRYVTADGREIVIGMAKHVQEAIGLPYEAFDNLNKELEHAWAISNGHYKAYCSYRKRIVNMPFWERLKGLFVGFL